MSDDFDDYDRYDDGDDSNTASGKYQEEKEMQIEVAGTEALIVKEKNVAMAKVPVQTFKPLLEQRLGRELSEAELAQELSNYSAFINIEASFTIGLETDSNYGADADGNRGRSVTFYGDDEAEIEFEKIELRLIDEDGNALGGEDFFVDLEDCPELEKLVAEEINSDPDQYVRD